MKFYSILLMMPLVPLGFSSCSGARDADFNKTFDQNPPFKVSEAYFQDFLEGDKISGIEAYIHISFSEINSNTVIQTIYFRNHILEAKGNINAPKEYCGYLNTKSQRNIVMDIDPIKEAQNRISKKFPFHLKENQAVLGYWYGGKKNFYKIENIHQKKTLPFQDRNKNQQE